MLKVNQLGLVIVAALLSASLPLRPDECDAIVGNLIAQAPGLKFDKRTPVEGATDIVYLKHGQAKELSLLCPAPGFTVALNSDWPD